MQRHQRDRALLAVVLVHVGDERDRLEERLHPRARPCGASVVGVGLVPTPRDRRRGPRRVARVELRRRTRGRRRRAPGRFSIRPCGLDRALGLELGEVAGALEHRLERAADAAARRRRSSSSMSSSRSRMPPSALPVTPAAAAVAQRLAERAGPRPARTPRPCATDVSPTPRLGTLTIRFHATSSSGFTSARR